MRLLKPSACFNAPAGDSGASSFAIVPASWRRRYWGLISVLCLYGGWLWLGGSGAGLFALWLAALRPWHSDPFLLRISSGSVDSFVMTPWLVTLYLRGVRVEVFRDELQDHDWSRLRATLRLGVDAPARGRADQPAAGRNTSS